MQRPSLSSAFRPFQGPVTPQEFGSWTTLGSAERPIVRAAQRPAADDYADSRTDTAAPIGLLSPGASIMGSLEVLGDRDLFRIQLTAGVTVRFDLLGDATLAGGTLADGHLSLYDSSGRRVASDDDSGAGLDARLSFRPTVSGTYFLEASAFDDSETGTYRLTVSGSSTPTGTGPGTLSIGDVSVTEGNSGTRTATFTVTREGGTGAFTVNYATANGSAAAGTDYTAKSGTLSFAAGVNSQQVSVVVRGDTVVEANENFFVNLSAPSNGAVITKSQGVGTVVNDDSAATAGTVSIADVRITEGDAGSQVATFTITRSAGTAAFSVNYATANGSATAGADFIGQSGTLNFAAGVNTQTVAVTVQGDTVVESDETFLLNLLSPTNGATLGRSQAVGTIVNNDAGSSADTWTLMVYIAGDNDLEAFGVNDINEMESVRLPANVNLVVLYDRNPGYDNSLNWSDTRWGAITYDGTNNAVSSNLVSLGELDTGSPATLTAFINRAAAAFPAQNYGLIAWDHGGGITGSCWDETSNSNLSLNEFTQAVSASSVPRFNLLGFDACLMGMVEQVHAVRGVADVLVASQELVPGEGWAYDRFLAQLAATPTMSASELATSIVNTYALEYAGQPDITLAAYNVGAVDGLVAALNTFTGLAMKATTADLSAMRTASSLAHEFPVGDSFDYRDLTHFMNLVAARVADPALRSAAQAVVTAEAAVVMARSGTVADAHGLSIFLPVGTESNQTSTYTAANISLLVGVPLWDDFIQLM